MSSRQRARLAKANGSLKSKFDLFCEEEESEEESVEEEPKAPIASSKFAVFDDSDEESLKSDDTLEELVIESITVNKSNSPPTISAASSDEAIESYDSDGFGIFNNEPLKNPLSMLFKIDKSMLDIDTTLRSRFGKVLSGDKGQSKQGKKGKQKYGKSKGRTTRQFLFGSPYSTYNNFQGSHMRPPSYAGGWVGVIAEGESRTADSSSSFSSGATSSSDEAIGQISPLQHACLTGSKEFSFCWGSEYTRMHTEYEYVQSTGDANQLAMFVKNNPFHLDSKLQLAMIYVGTGNMERAHSLVRNCITYLEYSFIDSFDVDVVQGNCRLDYRKRENKVLFAALFRHMQMTYMIGCPDNALHIALCLLSLDALGDPCHVLLSLDHFMLLSATPSASSTLSSAEGGISTPIAFDDILSYQNEGEFAGVNGLILAPASSVYALEYNASAEHVENGRVLTANDLPNWLYSHALYLYRNTSMTTTSSTGCDPAATAACRKAILSWPFILKPLLEKAGTIAGSKPLLKNWQSILNHPLFNLESGEHFTTPELDMIQHLTIIYVMRNARLWQKDDIISWLHAVVMSIVQEFIGQDSHLSEAILLCVESCRILCRTPAFIKYCNCNVDDFMEDFVRLPVDINPFEGGVIAGAVEGGEPGDGQNAGNHENNRNKNRRRRGGRVVVQQQVRQQRQLQHGPIDIENDINGAIDQLLEMQEMGLDIGSENEALLQQMLHGGAPNANPLNRGNLDPNLPMMQLFLSTVLPWNSVDTNDIPEDQDEVDT